MLRCKWISQRTILATIKTRIQSAHWSNPQIALFTAMVWYGKDTWNSYVVVSDNISHDRYCVDTFLRAILSNHGEKNPLFKYLRVLSDGAASQFKHKYNFANITPLKDDFNLKSLKRTFFFCIISRERCCRWYWSSGKAPCLEQRTLAENIAS